MKFPKDQRVRLKGKQMEALRISCFLRDGGRCTNCFKIVSLLPGYGWPPMHMAHIKSRGAGGSDVISNVRTRCPECHLIGDHNPKPVPRKSSPQERSA